MGNQFQTANVYDQHHFIRPNKIDKPKPKTINLHLPLDSLSSQVQRVFGINNMPVSHRADMGETNKISFVYSEIHTFEAEEIDSDENCQQNNQTNGKYSQKINQLEAEIQVLRSYIEEEKYRSKNASPVKRQIQNQSDSSAHIKVFKSRLSQTYFQTQN